MIKIAQALKQFIISFFKSLFTDWLDDFFILVGVAILIATTYSISTLIGNYVLGATIFIFGLILAKAKN
ncbi:hypothetical protein ACLIBH_12360 [Virgibacillus sp. W0430]|uniref:hypothetical protein n=1 Tax=Virgibacillus sp. W0430 TaxID=3391580 RepID=UPI003F48CD21